MSENLNVHLFSALLKAQSDMAALLPDSTNPHLRNEYASLAAVLKTCRPALAKHGLVLYQGSHTMLDGVAMAVVTSTLVHAESGESITEQLSIPLSKVTAQEIGSAITYGRRYLAMAQTGLAPDDDDGNDASQTTQKQPGKAQTQQQRPPAAQHRQAAAPAPATDGEKSPAFKRFMVEGTKTFNGDWDNARHWLIERYTSKKTPGNVRISANDLSNDECDILADALIENRKFYQDEWKKQPAQEAA